MSEKTLADQGKEGEKSNGSPKPLPKHQYSRDQLIDIKCSELAQARPDILEKAFDTQCELEDPRRVVGLWDPDKWYKSKFGSRESSPLTLTEGKDRRRILDIDRDSKRRPSINDPVERVKESERDGIVLSPQRRSFIQGCHVTHPSFSRQHSVSDADRERDDSRGERERERGDRDRERERPVRKVGSGRIQIDRENSRTERDFSALRGDRDRHDDRERDMGDRDRGDRDRADRDRGERDRGERDLAWNRDRYDNRNRGDREWERDRGDRERDSRDFRDSSNWERDRDRRFERSDRFQRPSDRDFRDNRRDRDFRDRGDRDLDRRDRDRGDRDRADRDRGDRDRGDRDRGDRDRDRGFDNRRRRNYHEEKEPEWFTSGPTSQNDTIELRGFEREAEPENETIVSVNRPGKSDETEKPERVSVEGERASKDSGGSEDVAEADGVQSQCSSPEDDQEEMLRGQNTKMPSPPSPPSMTQETPFPGSTLLDFERILKASLPLEEEHNIRQGGSRFSQFFTASDNRSDSDHFANEDVYVPQDLLEDPSSSNPSPRVLTPQGLMYPHHLQHLQGQHLQLLQQQQQQQQQYLRHLQQFNEQKDADAHLKAPSPLPSAYLPYVPNSAGDNQGGSADKASLPASVTALFNTAAATGGSNPPLPPNANFSAQDAEAQLKAMLFGGTKDSAPSSGTASPLPTNVHRKPIKTVAELEADMIQNSPVKKEIPPAPVGSAHQAGDMSAFNKLLTMVKAASETNQTMVSPDPLSSGHSAHGILSGNSEFNHALMRNKEQQLQLLHQSIQNAPKAPQQQVISEPPPIMDPAVMQQNTSIPPHYQKLHSMPSVFSQQPPQHLNAPSPIHPFSSQSLNIGGPLTANTIPSPSGMRSPIPRVPSPQEISQHAQNVLYNALVKKQLQDQKERTMMKQRERVRSPHESPFINVVKPSPPAQFVMPPNPQPKGAAVNTFTPTAVLIKMHSDKAAEKEKQTIGGCFENEQDFMPSVPDLSDEGMKDSIADKLDLKPGMDDFNDISFLDPVNPNLVPLSNQLDSSLHIGQTNVLPGSLSQPMSVEERLKLSMLAEKPGYLSQMLDKSKAAAEASRSCSHGRPIVKGQFPEQLTENPEVLQHHFPHMFQTPQQAYHMGSSGRPVMGSGGIPAVSGGQRILPPSFSSVSPASTNPTAKSGAGGRAIVGSSSVHQQSPQHSVPNADLTRMLQEQQMLRVSQQPPNSQTGVLLPHPSLAILGPPPGGVPISGPLPMMGNPLNPPMGNTPIHQQYARAQAQHNQQLLSLQHQGGMAPLRTAVPHGPVSAPLSPQNSGTLSQAALSATIQKVTSPHSNLFNCQMPPGPVLNGSGGKIETTGIHRWFSPDILRHQLPSMPPLPTHGNHVMTVDELERN